MARSHLSDFLQIGRFHVLDMSFSLPPVLLPVFGFRNCSLPQLNLDTYEVKEGNYEYPRKMIKGASVSNVVLEQGVSIFNSDFWDWSRKAVVGRVPPKNLLIIQFSRIKLGGGESSFQVGGVLGSSIFGNLEFAARVPGRAWLLKQCRPASYKPGTDFDGMSQDISIASLELSVEEFDEFNLGI